ncbi:SDR family NAD(P)-dependent oxidoreductase [Actinosynnema sp. NPDC023587]|uniref:SDR family NAD(P)-dependent oxidoreductase n=1 Tax=Actinosynnema sp. NPDC023587 TaxID=3154695 RepID=UPI0033C31F39
MTGTYLGAEGAPELLALLAGAEPGRALRLPSSGPGRAVVLRTPVPARVVQRHVLDWADAPAVPVRDPLPALPGGVVVLTNGDPTALPLPADAIVLTGAADVDEDDRWARGGTPAHVRVVVDLTDPALRSAEWSAAAHRVLDLHESVFLVMRRCAGWFPDLPTASFLVTVVSPEPSPFTGLFTGFTKSLALELPGVPVVATVHDDADPASALAVSVAELANRQLLPVVRHEGGRRLVTRSRPVPATPTAPLVPPDALVVAAGGGRGIGAAVLLALARAHRPRIVVLGSTDLASHDPALLDAPDDAPELGRARYIKARTAGGATVAQANAGFERLVEARSVRRTLTGLAGICGPGRVHYVRCDLRDTDAVRTAVGALLAEHGDVDLLLNVAGTNRASDIRTKSRADFTAVRDLKVRTYLNLRAAFADRAPRRWCNFGSFVGFTGQRGETDYGSANDFLNTAAECARDRGGIEFTIGWTLWRDTGLGAGPVMRAFLANANQFTATPTEEGVAHFLAELGHPVPPVGTVVYGDRERVSIAAVVPEYADFCTSSALPFVDEVTRAGPDEVTVTRTFDLDRDGFLAGHLVDGYPTLPGTFVPELAAEAAKVLVPHRVPAVFEDLVLSAFLRLYPDRGPQPKKIHARLLGEDGAESVVRVRVLADVVAPDGRVLVADREHFAVTVRMRDGYRPAPRWEHWAEGVTRSVADPYHAPDSSVLLTGVFVSTADTRLHDRGKRARLALDRDGVRRWFPDLLVPSVLLDGLARVAVLDLVDGHRTPVAVPRSIRRIEVFSAHNDLSLLDERVELYATPAGLDLEDPGAANLCVAATADGRVLLRIEGTAGRVFGHVDQVTGRFTAREGAPARAGSATRRDT